MHLNDSCLFPDVFPLQLLRAIVARPFDGRRYGGDVYSAGARKVLIQLVGSFPPSRPSRDGKPSIVAYIQLLVLVNLGIVRPIAPACYCYLRLRNPTFVTRLIAQSNFSTSSCPDSSAVNHYSYFLRSFISLQSLLRFLDVDLPLTRTPPAGLEHAAPIPITAPARPDLRRAGFNVSSFHRKLNLPAPACIQFNGLPARLAIRATRL